MFQFEAPTIQPEASGSHKNDFDPDALDQDVDELFHNASVAVPGEQIADASEWMRCACLYSISFREVAHAMRYAVVTGLTSTQRTTLSWLVWLVVWNESTSLYQSEHSEGGTSPRSAILLSEESWRYVCSVKCSASNV